MSTLPASVARAIERPVALTARLMSFAASVAIVAMMLVTVADVAWRRIVGPSIPGVYEYTEVLLVGVAYAGMAAAQRDGAHVRATLVTEHLPRVVAQAVRIVGCVVAAATLGWLAWTTLDVGLESMERGEYRTGLERVPIWPVKLVIPLSLLAFMLQVVVQLLDLVGGERSGGPASSEVEGGHQLPQVDAPMGTQPL